MDITVDLHTHSVASGHAYSTVLELAHAGAARGFEAIAITDHGPGLPQGPHPFHFSNQSRFAYLRTPCCILSGVEDDLSGPDGQLYLSEPLLKQLDVVLVGVHPYGWAATASHAEIQRSLLRAMERPQVKGVTHPVNAWVELDVKEIVRHAAATDTAVELNMSKIVGLEPRLRQFLEWVRAFDAPLMINSDAHCAGEVGLFNGLDHFAELIDPARVVNHSLAATVAFFEIHRDDVRARCQQRAASVANSGEP